jgi:flagellar biogenesis protein FliO
MDDTRGRTIGATGVVLITALVAVVCLALALVGGLAYVVNRLALSDRGAYE